MASLTIKYDRCFFLIILLCLLTNGFNLWPFGIMENIGRGFPTLLLTLAWMWYGVRRFESRKKHYHDINHFVLIFFISILPSVWMAKHLFNQSLIQSIISYRTLAYFLVIPCLIKIRPTIGDIVRGIMVFSGISLFFSILATLGFDFLFQYSEETLRRMKERLLLDKETSIFINNLPGYPLFTIPLYYYCQKIIEKFNIDYALKILYLFILLFLAQNRSCLFPALLFTGLSFLRANVRPRMTKWAMLFLIGIVGLIFMGDTFISLFEETDKQVTSTYDPRVVAMGYFLDFSRMSVGEILFGTGKISFVTSNYVETLQESHIHYSDVGFVGFWSQFGIAPVILFCYFLLRAFFSKKSPIFLKYLSAHILICSVTISYFDTPIATTWFSLCYYLFVLTQQSEVSIVRGKYKNMKHPHKFSNGGSKYFIGV